MAKTWINLDDLGAGGAGDISFDPSGTGLTSTTVQDAIAELDALKDTFQFTASRNATLSSTQALRRVNGVFLNVLPYRLPQDSTLIAITVESSTTAAWTLDIIQNGGSVHTEVKTGGSNFVTNTGLSIDFSVGDSLQIDYVHTGNNTTTPGATLYFRGR